MKPQMIVCKVVAAIVFLPLPAFTQMNQLALRHGTYVDRRLKCKNTPNAAVITWDGIGFSGAHSSRCTSQIETHADNRFTIKTVCAAVGDGTPDVSGVSDKFLLYRSSPTEFTLIKQAQTSQTYRWCSSEMPSPEKPVHMGR
jgi:hypothetical protein